MNMKNRYETIGWDVDTQRDFMEGTEDNSVFYEGKLKIEGAMQIAPALEKLTSYLHRRNIPVFGSVDWHPKNAQEFPKVGEEPDGINTFPEHCIMDTYGAEKIDATRALNPLWIDHDYKYDVNDLVSRIVSHRGEVFFRKNRFDVFDKNGNPYAKDVIKELGVKKAIVYGVALEVCNDFAIRGLQELGIKVYAVADAMRAINEDVRPEILEKWKKAGVKIINMGMF